VSKKTVSISVPAKASSVPPPARRGASEDWVRNPDFGGADPMSMSRAQSLVVDLAAERTLFEVLLLSAFVPLALGWFWLTRKR
jgi:hypothetical protein